MKHKFLMPFLTADGSGAGGAVDETAKTDPKEGQEQSFDDLLKNDAYKKDFDARVQKAVADGKAAWAQEAQTAADAAAKQEKLDALPEDEKLQAKLDAETARANKAEDERNAILLKQKATSLLSQNALPVEAAEFVLGKDEETLKSNIDSFQTMFSAAVSAAVKAKMPGYSPKAPTQEDDAGDKKSAIRATLYGK